jgi:hypothetical protein
MCALGLLFRLILWSCCLLAGLPLQAQEVKVRLPSIILHKTSAYTKKSIQRATCPIIHRLAVATTRTATRLKSSTLTETSTPNIEKMGSTFSFRQKRWNAIGIIRLDEITCAHRRPIPCSRRISGAAGACSAVNQLPKSVVREIRTPRSVGTGGGRPPPVTRWAELQGSPLSRSIRYPKRVDSAALR